MNIFALSLRLIWRDWRAGELNLLLGALLVAVAAIASVGFFVDRMGLALERQAAHLLGADLIVVGDRPLPAAFAEHARALGLASATTLVFPSMAGNGERIQLASVKVVSEAYPLRGRLRVASSRVASDSETPGGPLPGEAWADGALLDALGIDVGSSIEIGEHRLTVRQVITLEPDRGAGFVNFAPRLMIHQADLASTELIGPASRVTYRLLLAGDAKALASFARWASSRTEAGQRIESIESGRPELQLTLQRAQQFLSLVALLTALIAAVAVALGARRFAQRHLDGVAVMKALGATQSRMLATLATELLWIAILGGLLGSFVGWALHFALVSAVASLLLIPLPPASLWPALHASMASVVLLLGFGAWPFLRLAGVPPMRVLRRDLGPVGRGAWQGGLLAVICFAALLLWFSGDRRLAAYALAGFGVGAIGFAVAAYAAVTLLARLRGVAMIARSAPWRMAFASWSRRKQASVAQIVALSIGLMALMLLTVTRTDLIDGWRQATPADAPNRFVINVQPDQRARVLSVLDAAGIGAPQLYPMVRGRLVAVNAEAVGSPDDEQASRRVRREFNLSYMERLPAHNEITAGRWFDPGKAEASVEQGIMERLSLSLGDRLRFDIAGELVEATLSSVRKLSWDSMQVNFFVIMSPSVLGSMPQSWITAYHQPAGPDPIDRKLVNEMPNLTVFDLGNIIAQVRRTLDQVVAAVQMLFVLTLIAGIAVLYGALAASRDERMHEAALMRALGASRRQLASAQLIEIGISGALAGLLAAAGALAVGALLAERIFQFDLSLRWSLIPVGAVLGAGFAVLAGWLGLRQVISAPPMATLRDV